jgi:hypothetical protein
MTKSERVAIEIALDELDAYISFAGEEDNLEKLRWASRKLHELLALSPAQPEAGA